MKGPSSTSTTVRTAPGDGPASRLSQRPRKDRQMTRQDGGSRSLALRWPRGIAAMTLLAVVTGFLSLAGTSAAQAQEWLTPYDSNKSRFAPRSNLGYAPTPDVAPRRQKARTAVVRSDDDDTPKRRRDNSQARLSSTPAAPSLGHPRAGPSQPSTPPPAAPSMAGAGMRAPNGPLSHFMQHAHLHPQQQHQLGPLTPPQSMRSSVSRHALSSPATAYGSMI